MLITDLGKNKGINQGRRTAALKAIRKGNRTLESGKNKILTVKVFVAS